MHDREHAEGQVVQFVCACMLAYMREEYMQQLTVVQLNGPMQVHECTIQAPWSPSSTRAHPGICKIS